MEYEMPSEDVMVIFSQTYAMALGTVHTNMEMEKFPVLFMAYHARIANHCKRFLSDSPTSDDKNKVVLAVLEDCIAIVKGELVL